MQKIASLDAEKVAVAAELEVLKENDPAVVEALKKQVRSVMPSVGNNYCAGNPLLKYLNRFVFYEHGVSHRYTEEERHDKTPVDGDRAANQLGIRRI